MSSSFCAANHREWSNRGLAENVELDIAEYVNQEPDFGDCYSGEWFIIPDEPLEDGCRVIYWGTFGNYNSPGASHYTYAEVYDMTDPDDSEAFERDKAEWEAKPEYLETEEEEEIHTWEVIVGNVGSVYHGEDEDKARAEFDAYVEVSKENSSNRAFGEDVTLMMDHDIEEEYIGHLHDELNPPDGE